MPCNQCGECCRVLQFRFKNMRVSPHIVRMQKRFYEARGCDFQETKDEIIVSVPYVCPNLSGNLCSIHDTKPQVCRKWGEDISPMLKGCGYLDAIQNVETTIHERVTESL